MKKSIQDQNLVTMPWFDREIEMLVFHIIKQKE